MLHVLRKMPWTPVVFGAMLAISICMAGPVSAQALAGSIGPSVSPTGYFDCSLSGVWDDDGHAWAIFIYVDSNLVYAWNSYEDVTGPVYEDFNGDFGKLISGSPLVDPPIGPPGDPVYGALSGRHSCEMMLIKAGTMTPLYDSGVVYETF
jgi:hypothetical protein